MLTNYLHHLEFFLPTPETEKKMTMTIIKISENMEYSLHLSNNWKKHKPVHVNIKNKYWYAVKTI